MYPHLSVRLLKSAGHGPVAVLIFHISDAQGAPQRPACRMEEEVALPHLRRLRHRNMAVFNRISYGGSLGVGTFEFTLNQDIEVEELLDLARAAIQEAFDARARTELTAMENSVPKNDAA